MAGSRCRDDRNWRFDDGLMHGRSHCDAQWQNGSRPSMTVQPNAAAAARPCILAKDISNQVSPDIFRDSLRLEASDSELKHTAPLGGGN
jgi:hypothetical protein